MAPLSPLLFPSLCLAVARFTLTRANCATPATVCIGAGPSKRPMPGCTTYAQCDVIMQTVVAIQPCQAGSIFDTILEICNWEYVSYCETKSCGPTQNPTANPTTLSPTKFPTGRPTQSPTTSPTALPSSEPSYSPTEIRDGVFLEKVVSKRSLIENFVLVSYTSTGLSYPSREYKFVDFVSSLQAVIKGFDGDITFLTNEGNPLTYHYGLVNLAAFLAQAMAESIQYDACDELNWQEVAGRYAISNSCGQGGRSYEDEMCSSEERYMTCAIDLSMEITAISSGNQVRAPPPLTCSPGRGVGYYAGYWDTNDGVEVADTPYSNQNGRTDTEGCCWWGRGALSTRGSCNIGKFNFYAGRNGALNGRSTLYPYIDFCEYPEAICSSDITNELRWTIAFFEWAERIQGYSDGTRWAYVNQLMQFVDQGMTDDSFIDSVGRVLSHGCHREGCANKDVRDAQQRRDNFYTIINDVFDIPSILQGNQKPLSNITPAPAPMMQIPPSTPVWAPSLEIVNIPQPQPWPYGTARLETDMPTFEGEGLESLEGNGSDRSVRSLFIGLLSCVIFAYYHLY